MRFALIGVAAFALATPAVAQTVFKGPRYCEQYCAYQNHCPTDPVIDRFYRERWLEMPYNTFMDPSFDQCRPTPRRWIWHLKPVW
jgi:hypothetical protein